MVMKKMRAMSVVLICMLLSAMAFAGSAKQAWDALTGKQSNERGVFAFVENDPDLKNVLIYGDSISMGYTQKVRSELEGKANVYRIHCSGGNSSSFIDKMTAMHKVMRDKNIEGHWSFDWDVIHFNIGLHDLKHFTASGKHGEKNRKPAVSIDEYAENLKDIASYLNKLAPKAKLIFATTTPVPKSPRRSRFAGDALKYNKVALKVLKDYPQIGINDLYRFTKPNQPKWWSKPGNVHFTEEGYNAQGSQVARIILESLDRKKNVSPDERITYKTVTGTDGSDVKLKLHVFNPQGHKPGDNRPAIVLFFGGGWKGGSPQQFYRQSDYLASRGMVAISAEYRVRKKHGTSPQECVKDAKSAIRWVRKNASQMGIDPKKLTAGGGSAGGHVAAACGTVKGFNEEGEDTSVSCRPNALVLFNPVFDNGPEGYGYDRVKEYWQQFSPMHSIDKHTPPTVVFLGTKDTLIPVATAKKYKKLMEKASVRCDLHLYEDQRHGFFNEARYYETLLEADRFLISLGYLSGKPTLQK
ncbi:MAG: alpha/beta hydrolase fold domain-containing protein [Planctomycetes bacterium]|nr:alpha/beta hydrolase fold domain-containing protein [Planctomycetota bacterium]